MCSNPPTLGMRQAICTRDILRINVGLCMYIYMPTRCFQCRMPLNGELVSTQKSCPNWWGRTPHRGGHNRGGRMQAKKHPRVHTTMGGNGGARSCALPRSSRARARTRAQHSATASQPHELSPRETHWQDSTTSHETYKAHLAFIT